MGFARAALTVLSIYAATSFVTPSTAFFTCSTAGATCNGLVGYVPPNTTTLSHLQTLFGITHLRSLLGANNFPLSTSPNKTVPANQTINIPFPCLCTANGTGLPRLPLPQYTVVKDDFLYHIAAEVFSGLVTFQDIQAVNNISDANLIKTGQKLWIPLPCSCDEVGGERVVHYGHVVAAGSTLAQIAQQYNTSEDILLSLNPSAKNLLAGVTLDVPIKACTSMVANNSADYPLLISDATYAFTAGNCVKCSCDSANNWTLQCEASNLNSSCPAMQCQSADNLYIGNTTSSGCNRTTCAYAGYRNQTTILTELVTESTCPVPNNSNTAPKFSLQGWSWSWSYLLISIHLVVLCLHFI